MTSEKNQLEKKRLERKQIILDVKSRIQKGEPKQQVLEELSHMYEDKATIVKQIEKTPSLTAKAKCLKFNYMLFACLLLALILDTILIFRIDMSNLGSGERILLFNTALSIVLDIVFLVGVFLYLVEIYSWIAARALVTLFTLMISFGYYNSEIHILVYISLFLVIISFALGILMGVKLFPQRVPKEIEIDIDGVEKIKKTIYVYPD